MTPIRTTAIAAGALTLALTACSSEEPAPAPTETTATTAEYDPMTRDYTLGEEAKARRAELDLDAMQADYGKYRGDIMKERVRTGARRDAEADMTDDDKAEVAAAAQRRDVVTNMRARENMTWGYLDRDDDDKLSVVEYAVWAIPLDPNTPVANDQTAPFLTADQANKAADSFFYYDIDGDTYLSRREFTSARRGETIGG